MTATDKLNALEDLIGTIDMALTDCQDANRGDWMPEVERALSDAFTEVKRLCDRLAPEACAEQERERAELLREYYRSVI